MEHNIEMEAVYDHVPVEVSAAEFDLKNRDPLNINANLKVPWMNLVAEPEGIRSPKCVWETSYYIYRGTKMCCYTCLTATCFIPIAICLGLRMACLTFTHIWCMIPMSRALGITCHVVKLNLNIIMDACLGPICFTIGLIFSRGRLSQRYENPPPKYQV